MNGFDPPAGTLPCPLCGEMPKMHLQGNEYSKSRKLTIKCLSCRIQLTNAAMRYSYEWLEKITLEAWNKRTPPAVGDAVEMEFGR